MGHKLYGSFVDVFLIINFINFQNKFEKNMFLKQVILLPLTAIFYIQLSINETFYNTKNVYILLMPEYDLNWHVGFR